MRLEYFSIACRDVDFTFAKWRFALQNGPLRRCFTGLGDCDHSGWFYHNYCMLSSILFTLYFAGVALMFAYMIKKDFFDND